MKKLTLLFAFSLFVWVPALFGQTVQITGTVTSGQDNLPIPGVSVIAKGTFVGVSTDVNGKYTIVVPSSTKVLTFTFIGMKPLDLNVDGRTVIDAVMESDVFGLDEVIVTGVASNTPRKKLSITVDRVGEEALKEVPASSAAGALVGKVSGLKIVQANGRPGSAASIRLRGATTIGGSQSPLIIVDGVMIEGTLADINVDDIESFEVVKGAAASALYGSRAGNGVISIATKRGSNLAIGKTTVTLRNEWGQSQLANQMKVSTHHVKIWELTGQQRADTPSI